MKKLLVILFAGVLTACTTAPVKRTFPEVPKELTETCPDLKQSQSTTKLSQVISTVVENYGQYHECKVKVDSWNDWYTTQKQIFESVK